MNPNSSNQLSTHLFDIMQKQLHLVSKYNDYLSEIKQAISEGDAEQLDKLVTQQPIDIRQIESNRQQQSQLLAQHGWDESHQGLQDYLQEHGPASLKDLQQSLVEEIKQLEKALLINDLLIRKNQHRVRQTLQILSGHAVSDHAVTYSREGNTSQQNDHGNCIASA